MRVAWLALTVCLAMVPTARVAAQSGFTFVSDPAMCAMMARGDDVQETGMVLTEQGFSAIEYYCEFDTPIDLDAAEGRIQTRPGYCAEPGFIMPMVFAIQTVDAEAGQLRIWQQGVEQATEFSACPNL